MTHLIIQSFVGTGTWYDLENETLDDLYNNDLIPSFTRYCEKHNYKHVVYRDQIDLIRRANKKYGNNHGNLYHQYLSALNHRDDPIDYFVFPDVDYYITSNARPLVETNYIAGAPWMEASLIKKGKDPKTFKAVYGGIQVMTKEAAINLAEYLQLRFTNYIDNDAPIQMHPNMLTVGDWIAENNIEPENLSFYYNHILDDIHESLDDRQWSCDDEEAGFWHLYGKNKTKKLEYLMAHVDLSDHFVYDDRTKL